MKAVLHDGRVLEFPDGTDPAVVQATVRRVLGSAGKAPTTTQDSPSTVALGPTPAVPNRSAPEAAMAVSMRGTPEENRWGDQVENNPEHVKALERELARKDLTPEQRAVLEEQRPKALQASLLPRSMGKQTAPTTSAKPQESKIEGMLNSDGSSGWGDRVKYGLANAGIETGLGIKQLFTDLSPEDKAVLKMSRADVDASGVAGKTANVLGNIGAGVAESIAVPGAVFGKTYQALGKAAPYIKAALGSGAASFANTPVEAEYGNVYGEKAKEAAKAAAVGPLAVAGGQAVTKGATGLFQATKDAADLFAQGINPTLQQAAGGKVGRWVGGLTSGVTDVRSRQEQEVLEALTDRISKGQVSAQGSTAAERVGLLESSLAKDSDALLGGTKRFPVTNTTRNAVLKTAEDIEQSGGRFSEQSKRAYNALLNVIGTDTNAVRVSHATLKTKYLDPLDRLIEGSKDTMIKDAYQQAKDVLIARSQNARLTPDELTAVGELGARGTDLSRLKNATQGAGQSEMGVDVNKLATSFGRGSPTTTNDEVIGPLVRTLGATPRQDEARTLYNTLRRIGGTAAKAAALGGASAAAPITGAVTGPLYALSLAGQSAKGSRFLLGQNDWQQKLVEDLASPQTGKLSMAEVLRVLRDNSSTLGAGLTAGD